MKYDTTINRELPPMPGSLDGRNTERAEWAEQAIDTFQKRTGADDCDVLSDLLCDIMHLCDRCPSIEAFEDALARARRMYEEEAPPQGSEEDGAACEPEDRDADVVLTHAKLALLGRTN